MNQKIANVPARRESMPATLNALRSVAPLGLIVLCSCSSSTDPIKSTSPQINSASTSVDTNTISQLNGSSPTDGSGEDAVLCDEFWFGIGQTRPNRPFTASELEQTERRLGVKLPASLVTLLKRFNGGEPRKTLMWPDEEGGMQMTVPGTFELASILSLYEIAQQEGMEVHGIEKNGLFHIGFSNYTAEWLCLDYRTCGPTGEPGVVVFNPPDEIRRLAPSFVAFVSRLFYDEAVDYFGVLPTELNEGELLADVVKVFGLFKRQIDPTREQSDSNYYHPHWADFPMIYKNATPGEPRFGASFSFRTNKWGWKYLLFPEHAECKWLLEVNIHPKHRKELAAKLSELSFKVIPVFQADWRNWRPVLIESLDEENKQ